MNSKGIIRKVIYLILFIIMFGAFIYLGNKYSNNSKEEVHVITEYYKDLEDDKYKIVRGEQLISLLKRGKNLIIIGNKNSDWSAKYIEEIDSITEELKVKEIYYYDINNDKSQKNSNYYKIKEILKGNLITTDTSENNLQAPSFYILVDGKVKYYNIDTTYVKNKDQIENYWTPEKESEFNTEITKYITKYYLNK